MTQFMGLMTDPFTAGRADGANAPAFAEEDDSPRTPMPHPASRARRTNARPMPLFTARRRRARNYDPRWSVWGAGFGGSQTTDGNADARLQHHHQPHLRRRGRRRLFLLAATPSPALRSPAAAPASASTVSAAAAPTCSRPAPSSATPSARPMSPARWPMAGRT